MPKCAYASFAGADLRAKPTGIAPLALWVGAVTEYSHFGLGGEAPILIRTKQGKVFAA